MSDFKRRHFTGEVVLWAVRWYCRCGISHRNLETLMAERGVRVEHSTIFRWIQKYAPEMERRVRWQWRRSPVVLSPRSASRATLALKDLCIHHRPVATPGSACLPLGRRCPHFYTELVLCRGLLKSLKGDRWKSISPNESLPLRCLLRVVKIKRWRSQSSKVSAKSARQQYRAVVESDMRGGPYCEKYEP